VLNRRRAFRTTGTGLADERLVNVTAWNPSMVSREAVEACEGSGTARVGFRMEGPAIGPYPGTFVETGTLWIGRRTGTASNSVGVVIGAGTVLGFRANFHIRSGDKSIDGVKRLDARSGVFAGCDTFVDAPSPLNVGWRFTGFSIRFERLPVRYRATITTPNGAWVDRGTGFVSLIAEREVTRVSLHELQQREQRCRLRRAVSVTAP
jgi:hypothetical protein